MPGQGINISKENRKLNNIIIFITTINDTLYWKGYGFFFPFGQKCELDLSGFFIQNDNFGGGWDGG